MTPGVDWRATEPEESMCLGLLCIGISRDRPTPDFLPLRTWRFREVKWQTQGLRASKIHTQSLAPKCSPTCLEATSVMDLLARQGEGCLCVPRGLEEPVVWEAARRKAQWLELQPLSGWP